MNAMLANLAFAQDTRRTLTLREYTAGSPEYVYARSPQSFGWLSEHEYLYRDATRLVLGRVGDAKEETLLEVDWLKSVLGDSDPMAKGLKRWPHYTIVTHRDKAVLEMTIGKRVYHLDPQAQMINLVYEHGDSEQASAFSPDYRYMAVVRDHNLYIRPLVTRESPIQVTFDGSPTMVYGQSVHQNEFGISHGLFWSPDGRRLAFYQMDQSMVEPSPLLHVDARRPRTEAQYYPMAGTPSHQVRVGIYDLDTRNTTCLETSLPAETYLTNLCWSPDSRELLIVELNRAQTEASMRAYSTQTGLPVRTILTERNDKYTEPLAPARFVPGSNGKLFVWESRRDGYNHLYLYTSDGKLLRQLTKGTWEVTDVLSLSHDGRRLYYRSTAVSPLDRNVYSVDLKTGRNQMLTPEEGWHYGYMSPRDGYLIDSYEMVDLPRRVLLRSAANGKTIRVLHESANSDDQYLTPQVELGTIKAADATTELYYRLIKPHDYDPNYRYPAIVYVYNGPHAQLVQHRYRAAARGWELNMANEGYIILTVDGRGSAYRGAHFEQAIHRRLGEHEMADQMQGVELLRRLGSVDMNRIGVYGWSYGGFMTTNLMLTHPETFKVGVAGGPVMDWARYEIMYGERYMGHPDSNSEGYEASNLLRRAGDLRGRLLLIHGTVDPVVIWQHSLLFVQAAVQAGTHPDYMVYPEHPHNVIGPDRVHLNEIITRYFKDHL